MNLNFSIFIIVLLLVRTCSAHGVDISIRWHTDDPDEQEDRVEAVCTAIPPGECCKPSQEALPTLHGIAFSSSQISGLLQGQFAAGWGAKGRNYEDIPTCTGAPILRVYGPTYALRYHPPLPVDSMDMPIGEPHEIIFAASWLDLRTRFPPDSATARYLQYQGVGGLILGKDRWSAASDGIPFPKRSRAQKLNSWAPHGTALITTPSRWRYPDLYIVNGTNFTESGNGSFRSLDGSILDLTRLAKRNRPNEWERPMT